MHFRYQYEVLWARSFWTQSALYKCPIRTFVLYNSVPAFKQCWFSIPLPSTSMKNNFYSLQLYATSASLGHCLVTRATDVGNSTHSVYLSSCTHPETVQNQENPQKPQNSQTFNTEGPEAVQLCSLTDTWRGLWKVDFAEGGHAVLRGSSVLTEHAPSWEPSVLPDLQQ